MKTQIGTGIRKVREAIGMPRRKLATLAGIGYPHLARLEVGTATASLEALDDIAAGLGVPVWVIAFESDYDAEAERAALPGALADWREKVKTAAALIIERAYQAERRAQAIERGEVPPSTVRRPACW